MPWKLSVPTEMRCQTMKATPAMPSSSPVTLRQVSVSPRNTAAATLEVSFTPDVGPLLDICKLNDKIIFSGFMNTKGQAMAMLDLELLRSFVAVVDAGGFTRAGERVHRTQSTVSQQIKRLEEDVGQPLLNRTAKDVTPTEAGERLLSYARRLLALAEEARDVMARPGSGGAIRLGVPQDFAAYPLAKMLGAVFPPPPGVRMDVRPDPKTHPKRDLQTGGT